VPPGPARGLRRSPWRLAEYVALDFEATGLDLRRDRIISFGTVPIRAGRVDLGDAHYQLVDPGGQRPSAGTIVVHGIRPMDLDGAPSEEAARQVLRASLDGAFIVGWFAGIEAHFLSVLFGGSKERWLRRTIDTRDLLRVHEGEEASGLSLAQTADRFGIPVADPHHALDDALVTAQLFLILASHLARRDGVRTVGDLLAAKPVGPPVLRRPRAPV
jgi:DNA polymerase-3 subunit epsilon